MTNADKVTALLSELNEDEQAVVLRITERMVAGRARYAPLDLATDRRDWTREAEEEAWDLVAYVAMRTCARGRGR